MEKRIELNEAFYGAPSVGASSVYCLPTVHAAPCQLLDKPCIMGDIACPQDTPCLDTPCSDTPCSDSPCSDSAPTYTAPTFSIGNITENGCDVNVRPGSGYTKYRVFARLTSDPDDVSYDFTFSTSSAFTATMDALAPKTSYTVNVCGVIGNTSDKWAGAKTFTTSGKNRPGYFSWLRGLVSVMPGANELSQGGGIPPYLTADGWNDYTANINAVRTYKGFGQYSFTQAVAGQTVLSAAMVNEAITAITAMSPPVSPPGTAYSMQTPGSAALFNQLADSLNSIA